ncbi:MAG: 2-amino-4-hydroxy-6-hydroxymethyldihydropteridine diphosphokinase [Bacteroidia bacterium]|nr:2-amino-4-hydroxy-6-hydroxymethyldihydropteridine diphosphokinase [Bacteroidia bacterium]
MEAVNVKTAFLGIGSNLGDRTGNLRHAVNMIREVTGTSLRESSFYLTEPWGFSSDTSFLNMVVGINTSLDPGALLSAILEIEVSMGRIRSKSRYSSRVIDIDILLFGDLVINEEQLQIPHPHLHERKFVLVPLAEIAPDFIHPVFKKTVLSLLESCSDQSSVIKL